MKKTSKLFGAVALSAALALGTALPAFAAPAVDVTGNGEIKNGAEEGKTIVEIFGTGEDQISATLPMTITVSAPESGGAITAPNPSAYAITNNSAKAIVIDSVQAESTAPFKVVESEAAIDTFAATTECNVFMTFSGVGEGAKTHIIKESAATTLDYEVAKDGKFDIQIAGKVKPGTSYSNGNGNGKLSQTDTAKAVTLTYAVSLKNA